MNILQTAALRQAALLLLLAVCACSGGGTSGTGVVNDATVAGASGNEVCGVFLRGDGVPEASVMITSAASGSAVLTDAEGHFSADGAPDENGRIRLIVDGHEGQFEVEVQGTAPAEYAVPEGRLQIEQCTVTTEDGGKI